LPADIPSGDRRIVWVIDEAPASAAEAALPQPEKKRDDPIFGLGSNPIEGGVRDASENCDRYLYSL
jgi:hypothetical protein